MKGVLICGGTGTRLRPLTEITNKSLLPVYDQPLIYYPLSVLIEAGIHEIVVISGTEHIDQMASFLGSGARFGCDLSYKVQETPGGIAQALGLAEEFAENDDICAILGDNIYFDNFAEQIKSFQKGAHLFVKEVSDVERFGVVEIKDGKVTSIEEKPMKPKSTYAATGCYIYDARCFDIIRNLKPSARGEFEITDVSDWYLKHGELSATILKDEWIDAGTFESLHRASVLVRDRKLKMVEEAKTDLLTKAKTITPKVAK